MSLTRALGAFLLCAFCGLGVATLDGRWFAAALPLAAWLVLAQKPPQPRLHAARTLDPPAPKAGQPVQVRLALRNLGQRLDFIHIRDNLPSEATLQEGSGEYKGSLKAGETLLIEYQATFPRGFHAFENPSCTVLDPVWITSLASAIETAPTALFVYPATIPAPKIPAGPQAVRPFAGISGAKRPGEGSEFYGTRDYAPGDRLRSINWRAGALWGQDVVNVYQGERAVDVGILLDCRADAYQTEAQFEAAITGALSLAEAYLDNGNRVSLLRYGSVLSWVAPGAGRAHRDKLRRSLSQAVLGDHAAFERFDRLPTGIFPPRSQILAVSPLLPADAASLGSLCALGYALTVLHVLPGANTQPASPPTVTQGPGLPTRHTNNQGYRLAQAILKSEEKLLYTRLLASGTRLVRWDGTRAFWALKPSGGAA